MTTTHTYLSSYLYSGGSSAKAIYKCLRKPIDIRSSKPAIAEGAALDTKNNVDIIFSSFPDYAVEYLFDESHKGRMLSMFRNPVDRLTSKFFYLGIATWEKTYRPEWKDVDVLDWANDINIDNNHMVKKLAGKVQKDEATEVDLARAKVTIKKRMIVGLMDHMEESFNRYNTVMNINAKTNDKYTRCMNTYFGGGTNKKSNSNSHPKVDENHPAYQVLAEKNKLDIELYQYILEIFDEQKATIDMYANSIEQNHFPVVPVQTQPQQMVRNSWEENTQDSARVWPPPSFPSEPVSPQSSSLETATKEKSEAESSESEVVFFPVASKTDPAPEEMPAVNEQVEEALENPEAQVPDVEQTEQADVTSQKTVDDVSPDESPDIQEDSAPEENIESQVKEEDSEPSMEGESQETKADEEKSLEMPIPEPIESEETQESNKPVDEVARIAAAPENSASDAESTIIKHSGFVPDEVN